ncbi:phage virion morphogenesis protein [Campylobacter sp. RM13119]|uniref:phage virion morphogenesis protein n=1 Tax=Campylobacter californiensis TaxID=1032243 RepID=UPI001474D155|nr:phage virion morphogenesis protein [Campylobacter sp. RM13119]MBE3606100.1 phage virion morphogenesis protein [Campylobacter sp. RM13119]
MIEIKGLEILQAKLKNLQELDTKTKPLMKTLGNILQNEIEDSFENERSPFGEAWKPLASNTLDKKLKSGKSDKILRQDGDLADRWVLKTTSKEASISNNTKRKGFSYGLTHLFGTNKAGRSRSVKIPARPFLPVDKNGKLPGRTQEIIKDEVLEFIKKL